MLISESDVICVGAQNGREDNGFVISSTKNGNLNI